MKGGNMFSCPFFATLGLEYSHIYALKHLKLRKYVLFSTSRSAEQMLFFSRTGVNLGTFGIWASSGMFLLPMK